MSYYVGGIAKTLQNKDGEASEGSPNDNNANVICSTPPEAPKKKLKLKKKRKFRQITERGENEDLPTTADLVPLPVKKKKRKRNDEMEDPQPRKKNKLKIQAASKQNNGNLLLPVVAKRKRPKALKIKNEAHVITESDENAEQTTTAPVKMKKRKRNDAEVKETPTQPSDGYKCTENNLLTPSKQNDRSLHQEQGEGKRRDPEQEQRTVFVGNLPLNITRKDLKTLFKCYGRVECVRLRSAVPSKTKMTKKAAVISQQFNEEKTSINGYVVMESIESAKKALVTNGLLLQGHHIRVDMAEKQQYDTKFTVFVGNLPFRCQDEELYSFFDQNTEVDSVRIVRDSKTGICKGFGFVMFKSKDSVELAIKMNGMEFKGRMLRVKRASKLTKKKTKPDVTSRGMKKSKEIDFRGVKSNRCIKDRAKVQKKIKRAGFRDENKMKRSAPGNRKTKGPRNVQRDQNKRTKVFRQNNAKKFNGKSFL